MDVHKMLEQVKAGQLDIAEAEAKLKDLPYEFRVQVFILAG